MVTKELIERFFKDECSAEEQQHVMEYMKANADEFAQYLDENEWEQFKYSAKIDDALSRRLFANIQQQTTKKTKRIKLIRGMAAAAAVLLLMLSGWKYFSGGDVHIQQPVAAIRETADSVVVVTRHKTNYSGKDKTIQLEDGSLVILANNSEIVYRLPFTNTRTISVVGKAFFKVAKDKTKPFIVTSGAITTTALGTQFTVAAIRGSGHVVVRLYEGKVVIQPVNKANRYLKKDVYLLPGQEFVYGEQALAKKQYFKIGSTSIPEQIMLQESEADNPSVPQNIKGSWFQFNNRPVSEVFDQLAEIYKVEIVYEKKDVENIYFIGKYNSSDSVETILKRIGMLNQLSITKNGSAFIINK